MGVVMALTYFKRYRMEMDLAEPLFPEPALPRDYRFVPWERSLLETHADTKYRCFFAEIDANVFPCLGEADGCLQLMDEISQKDGFLAGATWLIRFDEPGRRMADHCGTIQGIRDRSGMGSVQNLGITPEHRGCGLGTCLLNKALSGFRAAGLRRVFLEVTAQNAGAVRLYRRIGFRKVRTVYKAVEVAYS